MQIIAPSFEIFSFYTRLNFVESIKLLNECVVFGCHKYNTFKVTIKSFSTHIIANSNNIPTLSPTRKYTVTNVSRVEIGKGRK